MRRLQSVLARLPHLKPPQRQLLTQLLGLLLMLPGQAPWRHLSRDSPDQEQTVARWSGHAFDFVRLPTAALPAVVPPSINRRS
jgi:hypothetical protein